MVALLVAVALGAAACGGGGDGGDAGAQKAPETTATPEGQMDPTAPEIEEPIEPMARISEAEEEEAPTTDADEVMVAAALDVEAFWQATYPDVYGEDYQDLEGGLWSYNPDIDPADLPPCPGVTSYDDIAVNAFYCSDVDLIAWDRTELVEPFIEEFGAFTAAVVMAHEFGHAIQARTGDFDTLTSVISELQADCFAGAWVAYVAEGNSETFEADLDELDVAIAGLIEIRDAPGSSPDDPQAHGSGFDRVSAFSDGIEQGAARCAEYREPEGEPVVVQQVFQADEESSMGDVTADELLELIVGDMEAYYAALFASELNTTWTEIGDVVIADPATDEVECGGGPLSAEDLDYGSYYCVEENTVVLDGGNLVPALVEIGDFALGAELARNWAFAAQVQQGIEDDTKETFLNADCLTGLYAGDVFFQLRDDSDVRLSAGDLDEAIISFLAFGGDEEADAAIGSPFERADAFRTGFLGSFTDCEGYLA